MAPASEGEMASNGGTGERFLPLAWFAETTGLAFVDENKSANGDSKFDALLHISTYICTYISLSLSLSFPLFTSALLYYVEYQCFISGAQVAGEDIRLRHRQADRRNNPSNLN